MDQTAATPPLEYLAAMLMNGVGLSLGLQLIAEIGDVTRFTHREALIAFAGVDSGKNDSGQHAQKVCVLQRKALPAYERHFFKS